MGLQSVSISLARNDGSRVADSKIEFIMMEMMEMPARHATEELPARRLHLMINMNKQIGGKGKEKKEKRTKTELIRYRCVCRCSPAKRS